VTQDKNCQAIIEPIKNIIPSFEYDVPLSSKIDAFLSAVCAC